MRFRVVIPIATAALCFPFLLARAADPIIIADDHPIVNDPEALQAMEIFMGMSPEEREETIQGLLEAVGDDPQKRAEMEALLAALPAMEAEQANKGTQQSNLKQMVQDDEFAKLRQDARKQLDGTPWEFFVENEAAILEATITSGQLSVADATMFRADKKAWMKQLRVIWEDAAKQQEL